LIWGVSQTPRAEFHVASGTGGRGEQAPDILDHYQARSESCDSTGDVPPQPGTGVVVEPGTTAGDRDVFDRENQP
jgi:hypothetical protein